MGEELPFGGQLFFSDGTKLCEVTEIPEFIDTENSISIKPIPINVELGWTFQMSQRSLKRFMRIICGWRAKGPMRTRAVIKEQKRLWRMTV